jgi:FkbM family methyltransferase
LNKPYYYFRPRQLARRLKTKLGMTRAMCGTVQTLLPWGLSLRCRPDDVIGAEIIRSGVYDLCVSETLWRLLDHGSAALDVGANIGYMTSLLAARVGEKGRVDAFEPHPAVFGELHENVASWQTCRRIGRICTHKLALSDKTGFAKLLTSAHFEKNRGTTSIGAGIGGANELQAPTQRLENLLEPGQKVDIMKLDVEGHEINVLRGAGTMLKSGAIRDIVFEEWRPYPTEVTQLLEDAGYSLFGLDMTPLGIEVTPTTIRPGQFSHNAPSYLATRAPERALGRLSGRGWATLGSPLPWRRRLKASPHT